MPDDLFISTANCRLYTAFHPTDIFSNSQKRSKPPQELARSKGLSFVDLFSIDGVYQELQIFADNKSKTVTHIFMKGDEEQFRFELTEELTKEFKQILFDE